jgi:hypothetical protein
MTRSSAVRALRRAHMPDAQHALLRYYLLQYHQIKHHNYIEKQIVRDGKRWDDMINRADRALYDMGLTWRVDAGQIIVRRHFWGVK